MKILFIQDTLANAGTEKSMLQLLPLFSEESDCKVVYLYAGHDLREEYLSAGISLEFLDLRGKYDFFNALRKLNELVRKDQPDIMVSSLMRANLLTRAISKINDIPLVGTLVNDSYNSFRIQENKGNGFWKFRVFWMLDRWTSNIPVHWISNATCLVNSHNKTLGISSSKVSVVYRGRSITDEMKRRPVNSLKFVTYGRLLERKGFLDILEAVALVKQKFPFISMDIFGEGPLENILKERIVKLKLQDNVALKGVVIDPQVRLKDYGVFVFPSHYEGFSGALVEAMMAGIPIIASDIPMNLEAVKDQESALVFPVKNIQSLAEKMIHAIEHPEEMAKLGAKAREVAMERFDIEKIAKEYEAVLHKVYQKHKK
ncbi:glycosyltransferase involved in cell wall biosynthesis [Algoriphagus sp. 4150]|uniref:glycosyltransferase family 4 protein n=1 Tax=Algoriphagus sp. 4150 TaxID=2817756 RepID=UPI002856675A|nr:glycosyltransferase family 4 protein [Algoriphagus sp. 4150]MDR7127727.1 glycosyltransferase involved in cell wall biosynthesis [Algoriphagus sp. 4150]